MDLQLAGRLALVSGSTKGIGLAIATGLAREGVTVIVTDFIPFLASGASGNSDCCHGGPLASSGRPQELSNLIPCGRRAKCLPL
jgi:NAD(P)-dependent dehydrogenase (short-subunit alcohol dehydrogenase family)